MAKSVQWIRVAFVMVAVLLALVACGSNAQPLTEAQVRGIADDALSGLASGEYEAWTRRFSAMMKSVVPEEEYQNIQAAFAAQLGVYQGIASIESGPAEAEGHVRWTVTDDFEKGPYRLIYVVPESGGKITGVHFEAVE